MHSKDGGNFEENNLIFKQEDSNESENLDESFHSSMGFDNSSHPEKLDISLSSTTHQNTMNIAIGNPDI
jgi:hypothetical protein